MLLVESVNAKIEASFVIRGACSRPWPMRARSRNSWTTIVRPQISAFKLFERDANNVIVLAYG